LVKLDKASDASIIPCRIAKSDMPVERGAKLPPAVVDGKFIAPVNSKVYAWRERSGYKPSWYRCKVIRVADNNVELWDEIAEQWYCFNPSVPVVPDVRLSDEVQQSPTAC